MKFILSFVVAVAICCQFSGVDAERYKCPGISPEKYCDLPSFRCIAYCNQFSTETEEQPMICPGSNPPVSCGGRTGRVCLDYCAITVPTSEATPLICPGTSISCGKRGPMSCRSYCRRPQNRPKSA